MRLLVEVLAVGDDDERPVPRHLAEHLLREEEHRHRLARALGVPEDAELAPLLRRGVPQLLHPGEGVVDTEVLVVAGEQLDEPTGQVLEDDEVLDQVEQAFLGAHAPDDRLQRDRSFLALGVDLLPLREELPARRDGPHLGLRAVGEDDEAVRGEQVRDGVAVVAEVVVVGVLQVAVRRLQLDEHERDAVDEADQVGAPVVQVGVNPELRDEQEVVVLRVLPVDDGELLRQRRPIRLTDGHLDTVAHQRVDLLVRAGVVHGRARLRDLGDRLLDRLAGHAGIESLDRGAQAADQEDLRLVVAAERSIRSERLVVRVDASASQAPRTA